jgi:hypothetical protein
VAIREEKQRALRKFVFPTVAGAIATGAALFLTRKQKSRGSDDGNGRGIGDLADDLRRKLDSVLSKSDQSRAEDRSDSRPAGDFIPDEFAERRREREQRRDRRRARA